MLINSDKFNNKKFVIEYYEEEVYTKESLNLLNRNVSLALDSGIKNMCSQVVAIMASIVGKILFQNLQSMDILNYENHVQYFFEALKNFGVRLYYYSSVLLSVWFMIKWVDDLLYANKIKRKISDAEKSMTEEFYNFQMDSGFKFDSDLFDEIIQDNTEELSLKLNKF